MRGYPRFVSLIGLAVVAGVSFAHASARLQVSPVPQPGAKTRPGQWVPAPVDPEVLRIQAERQRRRREFPHDVSRGGDRSRFAARRVGWRHPHAVLRGPGTERIGIAAAQTFPDTVRVAFIRIDFLADRGGNLSTGNGRFDLSGPDTLRPPIDRPPHNRPYYLAHREALRRYYDAQSYGNIVVEGDVWPRSRNGAYSLSDMADFGPWRLNTDVFDSFVHMYRSMLFAADSQSIALGERIPWNDYDRFVIIHAGADFQTDVRQDSPEDIPSFTITVSDSDAVIFPDSVNRARPIDRAAVIPETDAQDGFFSTINGVLAHECGHLFFGFADLYNILTFDSVVGFWSLMDSGDHVGSIVNLPDGEQIFASGLLPPSIDPWHRFRFMLNDELPVPEVAYGDTFPIQNSERHPDVRTVSLTSDEYLMLENRYLAPADSVHLEQDDSTRVVLGPDRPDRFEYDALLAGGGILVWHIDESVYPNEFEFPCDSSGRANYDCGINTNFNRRGVSVIEADALADLGDPGSPFYFGAPFDPYFRTNNPSLGDTTKPNLIPNIGTRPHIRLDFLDEPDSIMQVGAFRTWQLPGWPVESDFPPGGPVLLAVDADGDRSLEVCWAGGDTASADSASLFAVRVSGAGLAGPSHAFARGVLDRRPRPVMAALPRGSGVGAQEYQGGQRGALFAVSTYASGADTSSPGGRVWLIHGDPDSLGQVVRGWPPPLPSIVTTPPVIAGELPNAVVYVGCANGRVYAVGPDGTVLDSTSVALRGGVRGRLAVMPGSLTLPAVASGGGFPGHLVAAGGAEGEVGVFSFSGAFTSLSRWPQQVGGAGFEPDFLWIDFGGALNQAQDCFRGALSLVVRHADRLWAYCLDGQPLAGWGRDVGDTLVAGLGAGDPDGDGFPEVLTQSVTSQITFWNLSGYPSPGWPKRGTRETFRTGSPPLALDLDGDQRGEVVAMNASGIVAALTLDGKPPEGWPLASSLDAVGAPLAADLDRDGTLELVAPARTQDLYAYSIPTPASVATEISWVMAGGDPGRTSALILEPTQVAPGPSAGPLVPGSLWAYPNPARRRPVSFAYQLTEPADVEIRILDTSGHEVASFSRRGRQADNLEVWDPGSLPAGLYLARLRFRGAGTERTEVLQVGLLR